jgi:hypothetical protein
MKVIEAVTIAIVLAVFGYPAAVFFLLVPIAIVIDTVLSLLGK